MQLFLHIGLPKTATSTIQRWLGLHAPKLQQHGVYTFDRPVLSHRLAVETITNAKRAELPDVLAIKRQSFEEAVQLLGRYSEMCPGGRCVVSSEYFSESDIPTVRRLFERLGFTDIRIVVVIRRQDRYLESQYNQSIKAMGRQGAMGRPGYSQTHDWHVLLSSWAREFSPQSILPLNFDRLVASGKSVIEGFVQAIDPGLASALADQIAEEPRSNPSLRAELLEFKRVANAAGNLDILRFLELARQHGLGGPAFRMNVEHARAFMDIHRESNDKVAREFFGSSEALFDESDLSGESAGADLTGQLSLDLVASLLALHVKDTGEKLDAMAKKLDRLTRALDRSKA